MRSLSACLFLLAAAPAAALGPWSATAPLPAALDGSSVVALGGAIYVIGGWDGGQQSSAVYYATPAADGTIASWSRAADLPLPRAFAAAATDGAHIWVMSGMSGLGVVNSIDVSTGAGSQLTWANGGLMPSGWQGSAAVYTGNGIYVAGGDSGGGTPTNVIYYAPVSGGVLGSWTQAGTLGTARTFAGIGYSGGSLGVGGGADANGTALGDVEGFFELSPGTLSASQPVGGFSPARYAFGCAQYGTELYVVAGSNGPGSEFANVDVGTISTTITFAAGPPLPSVRSYLSSVVVGHYLYAVAGHTSTGMTSEVDFADVNVTTPPDGGPPPDAGVNLCAGVTCTALDPCHLAGTCDPASGTCSNPIAPNGTACNDGNPCTTGDACTSGVCGGTPVSCITQAACLNPTGTCDGATGQCLFSAVADGTPCGGGTCQGGQCVAADGGVVPSDGGSGSDAGATADAGGTTSDGGGTAGDAGTQGDGGCVRNDAGVCKNTGGGGAPPPGCGCGVGGSGLFALIALAASRRRRSRA